MNFFSISLPNKIALSIFILLCVALIPLVYLTTNTLHANLEKQLSSQQFTYTSFVASDLENKIELRIQALQDVAGGLPSDKIKDKFTINAYLESRLAIYRLFSLGIVVIGRDGFGVADHPHVENRDKYDYKELEYFQEVISTGKVAIGKPRVGHFTKKLGVGIAVPIKDKYGVLVGVMAGYISLTDSAIFDQSKAKIGKSGEYVLVSVRDKTIITDTDVSHTLQPVTILGKNSDLDKFIAGKEGSAITKFIHGRKSLTSTKHLLAGRWLLLAILPADEAFAPINNLEVQILKDGFIVFLIIAALMWLLMHIELKPLTTAANLISKMAQHGKKLHDVPVKSNDEVGRLLTAFNILQRDLHDSYTKIEQQAHQDFLTGLANRRYFLDLAELEITRSIRYGSSLAVCMLDIDFFKKVNDAYGHKVGDVVLKKLSALLGESLRKIDIAGRIGGEEFAIVLPETDKKHAYEVAERIRNLVEDTKITLENDQPLRITVSIGIAMFDDKGTNIDILLNAADQALYQAKNTGRNRVCMYDELDS